MKFYVTSILLIAALSIITVKAESQADRDKQLWEPCSVMSNDDDVDAVEAALAKGANINYQNEGSGHTPLMGSMMRGKIDIFTYLLEAGADVTIRDLQGYTPADGAAFQGRPNVMKMLIDRGVDVNIPHDDGLVPLIRSCKGTSEDHFKVFKMLVDSGVDPFIPAVASKDEMYNNEGKTCMDVCRNDDIEDWLDERLQVLNHIEPEDMEEEIPDL